MLLTCKTETQHMRVLRPLKSLHYKVYGNMLDDGFNETLWGRFAR